MPNPDVQSRETPPNLMSALRASLGLPESFRCERCAEFVPDVALAYSANGDSRLYCSEKCLGKPGEAGDEGV